jgi:hypothetical protein
VRLYELAYCCHVYAVVGGYDAASAELRRATGRALNPAREQHTTALFAWLRRWGCRQFAVADEAIARDSLLDWWRAWQRKLPPASRTIVDLDDRELDGIASAYESLRTRQAAWQRRAGSSIAKTFGATGSAKTLFAIRPHACPPWDAPIRRKLAFPATGEGYRLHLVRARDELAEALADLAPGMDAAELPALLGRPDSTLAKLVDEHDWVRFTHGTGPPPPELLERWAAYARRAASSRSAS